MTVKYVLMAFVILLFIGCDKNYGGQGRCEEGFVEQIGPDNTYFCAKKDEEN